MVHGMSAVVCKVLPSLDGLIHQLQEHDQMPKYNQSLGFQQPKCILLYLEGLHLFQFVGIWPLILCLSSYLDSYISMFCWGDYICDVECADFI